MKKPYMLFSFLELAIVAAGVLPFANGVFDIFAIEAGNNTEMSMDSVYGRDVEDDYYPNGGDDNRLIRELVHNIYGSEDVFTNCGTVGVYRVASDGSDSIPEGQIVDIDDSLWKLLNKYATDSFISAYRHNFVVAKKRLTSETPSIGTGKEDILSGSLLCTGTDGMTEAEYKGYKITDIEHREGGHIAIVNVTLSADIVDYDYNEVSRFEISRSFDTCKVKLKVAFSVKGTPRKCKMTDIMILSSKTDEYDDFPYNKWLKQQMLLGKVFSPVVY